MLQKSKIAIILVVLLLAVGCEEAVKDDTLTIAENGVAKAVIVIAEDAGEPEQHAAVELADFLQQITGAKFEIIHPPVAGRPRLLVGSKAAKLAVPDFSTDGLGTDGIIIRSVGNNLILAGGYPRGP